MKKIALFFLIPFLVNCNVEDWSIPQTQCAEDIPNLVSGFAKEKLYQQAIDEAVRKGIPGLVLLVRTGEDSLWIGSSGKAKIESNEAMMPCHIHHSASVAKMYMATAAMLLVEDGLLELDAPVKNYLDEDIVNHIDNCKKATVRQLLNHTSGIRDFVLETNFLTDYFNDYFHNYNTADFLKYVYDKPSKFAPGSRAEYSNINTVLLTLIIDKVAGSHADVISDRIIKKLDLKNTFYKNEQGYPNPNGLVNSYWDRYSDGKLENITKVAIHFDETNVGHDAMLATAYDYSLFINALMQGKLVSHKSLNEMMTWKYDQKDEIYNGFGLLREITPYGDAIGHAGGNFGVAMQVQYYPERDVTIVLCTNISGFFPSPARDEVIALAKTIENLVLK